MAFGSSSVLVQSMGHHLVVRTARMGPATHDAMVVTVLLTEAQRFKINGTDYALFYAESCASCST